MLGRGCGSTTYEFFLKGLRTAWRIALKNCIADLAFFAQLFAKKIVRIRSGHGAITSYEKQPSTNFSRKACFQPRKWRHWLEWRHFAWFGSTHDHIWHLTLHHDHSKVIRSQWPWLTPSLPILANFVVLGVSWGPETEYDANFSHRHVYSACLHYTMPISHIDEVCT